MIPVISAPGDQLYGCDSDLYDAKDRAVCQGLGEFTRIPPGGSTCHDTGKRPAPPHRGEILGKDFWTAEYT